MEQIPWSARLHRPQRPVRTAPDMGAARNRSGRGQDCPITTRINYIRN